MTLLKYKKWATPLTIGTFIVSAVSGMLMFFKINFGLLRVAHEWISVLLVLGGIFHVVANFGLFKKYFYSKTAVAIISLFVAVGILCFVMPGNSRMRPNFTDYSVTLQNITLPVVAEISKSDCTTIINHLSSHGVAVKSSEQTISEIASMNKNSARNVLAIVFEESLNKQNNTRK
jgi:hypothetical protein